jgi:hypothetical protein
MKDYTPIFEFGHGLLIPTSVNSIPPKLFLIDTGSGVLGFAMLWMLDMKIDYRDGLVKFTVETRFVQ